MIRLFFIVLLTSVTCYAQVDNPNSPGGSNTQVQFNDGGAFNGDAGLTYDKTNDKLTISHALTTTTSDGLLCENPTAATSGNQKVSPAIKLRGRGYTGSTSHTMDFLQWVSPAQGNPISGTWKLQHSVDGATAVDALSYDSTLAGRGFQIQPPSAQSNGSPSTTRMMTFENSGGNTYTDYRFSGTLRSSEGHNSSGGIDFYQSGGNGVAAYQCNSGLTSCSLHSYNTSTAFVHYGYGEFGAGITAGSVSQPTSMVTNLGSLENKVLRYTASTSMAVTDQVTNILCDGTTAAACSGTPSNACSSHANQTACENYDAHGGCTWNAGTSCSVYNNESGMGTCSGTSGCTAETSACSGGDESSCLASDDSYGGSCAWNSNDCSALDESTCGMTSGCSQNYYSCSTYDDNYGTCTSTSGCSWSGGGYDCALSDGTDQGTCEGNSGCMWSDPYCIGSCSGTYYSGCSGTYYTCGGTYYTGNCNGTFGANCSGTSSCSGIDDSTNCGLEAGCTWSSVLNLTLPNNPPNGREYRIKNIASGGADCVILPYTGYDVEGASSLTLAAYKDSTLLVYFGLTADCSTYNGNESTCGSTSGCTQNYSYCTWDSGMMYCNGNASCNAIGDEPTCSSTQYFYSCSGTYYTAKRWHVMADSY